MAEPNVKQIAQDVIGNLPDSATWNDVIGKLCYLQAVDEGIDEANRAEFAKDAEVKAAFNKWGVTLEA